MLYREFGKTKEKISILGFGCMRLPVINNNPAFIDEEKATRMLRHAIDQGVNYIDTAYPYHGVSMDQGGASEPFLSKALKDGYREKVKIATKLPSWAVETSEDLDKFLNEQLKRLETDCIDFYMMHGINKYNWKNLKELGFEEFLDEAIDYGRIKHVGFSFHDRIELFKKVVDHYDWSFCTIQFNYMDDEYQAGKEGMEYASANGLGIAVMEPLRGGQLATNIPVEVQELFDGAEMKRSPAEWALRWVWNHPEVSVVMSGMNTMEQVRENLKIAQEAHPHMLNDYELNIIEQAKSIFEKKVKISCTNCGYCLPCPSGVNIPENFAKYNDYFLFGSPEMMDIFKFNYYSFVAEHEQAAMCRECGVCEEHCPQGIRITHELKEIKEFFE